MPNSKGNSRQLSGLVVINQAIDGPGFKPQVGSPRIFKIDFHLQKLSSLLIAYDMKLEGALYSLFSVLRQAKDPGYP